jgi:hypothetical protein
MARFDVWVWGPGGDKKKTVRADSIAEASKVVKRMNPDHLGFLIIPYELRFRHLGAIAAFCTYWGVSYDGVSHGWTLYGSGEDTDPE